MLSSNAKKQIIKNFPKVGFSYEKIKAVQNVTLKALPGTTTAFVGFSGSGM